MPKNKHKRYTYPHQKTLRPRQIIIPIKKSLNHFSLLSSKNKIALFVLFCQWVFIFPLSFLWQPFLVGHPYPRTRATTFVLLDLVQQFGKDMIRRFLSSRAFLFRFQIPKYAKVRKFRCPKEPARQTY